MKRKLNYPILLTAFLVMVISGIACTRNNGDIGPIFGRWILESADCRNCPQITWEGDLFLAFQNDVVQMTQTFNDNYSESTFGSFRLTDNTMFIDFKSPLYPVNPAFGIPAQAELQLLELTGNKLVIEYNPTEDSSITYTFHKW